MKTLLSFISPYTLYLKIGLLVIVALYIGWLNIQKGRFEGKAIKFEAESKAKDLEIKSWSDSFNQLNVSVENQNEAVESYKLATEQAKLNAIKAIKKSQSIVQARQDKIKQSSTNNVFPTTCDSAVDKAKSDLEGSDL